MEKIEICEFPKSHFKVFIKKYLKLGTFYNYWELFIKFFSLQF